MHFARLAGEDAANKRMRKAGRRKWNSADYNHATRIMHKFLEDLGFGLLAA